ncbi:hypothetical protein H4R20_000346 [Coemansia guatemalensis]|uniref:Uncharacterized protein n=1 Tax=Coemansia guatemalensis TaxID=2761395 RepID=A0A9W8LX15_9FUNG|nr:hypothetical protein H4R20_000346 [Coemansia guatemalensis]
MAQMLKSAKVLVLDTIRFPVVTTQSGNGEMQVFAPLFADENTDMDHIDDILEKSLALSTNKPGTENKEHM